MFRIEHAKLARGTAGPDSIKCLSMGVTGLLPFVHSSSQQVPRLQARVYACGVCMRSARGVHAVCIRCVQLTSRASLLNSLTCTCTCAACVCGVHAEAFTHRMLVQVHVRDFKRLALDASCLMHRGGRASAADYLHSRPSSKWLGYPLRIVDAILNAGTTPVVVFDGAPLPMKARTDALRAAQRQAHRRTAAALLQEGKAAAAEKEMAAALEVTAEMRHVFITALQARRVEFVVAPYEADSQLVFLVESGQCDAAVTEDSDLLAYRCPRTLYKLQESGHARLIKFADLSQAEEGGRRLFDGSWHDEWSSWEGSLFTDMCILAGCDFLDMPTVGIKTAHKQLRQHKSIEGVLNEMIRAGTLDSAQAEAYLEHFYRVQLVFRHQRVWDAAAQEVVMLCCPDGPLADVDSYDTDCVGPPLPPEVGRLVSLAALDPRTLLPTPFFVEEVQPTALAPAVHLQPPQ